MLDSFITIPSWKYSYWSWTGRQINKTWHINITNTTQQNRSGLLIHAIQCVKRNQAVCYHSWKTLEKNQGFPDLRWRKEVHAKGIGQNFGRWWKSNYLFFFQICLSLLPLLPHYLLWFPFFSVNCYKISGCCVSHTHFLSFMPCQSAAVRPSPPATPEPWAKYISIV